jgi:UDP-galactopyranose mutase
MEKADVVFTGGQSLYEAKKDRHANIYAFPSSIETAHFARARQITHEPADQQSIPHPRLGFYGVIDERFDIELIREVAAARPEWHFVFLGPVVKIDPATLPQGENIHWLGQKTYDELPVYLAGWDVALIPFQLNESTRFISPTKTPEYLAAGIPVISSSIRDVVFPYGNDGLVAIADDAPTFMAAAAAQLQLKGAARDTWRQEVDSFLSGNSWDTTQEAMFQQIKAILTDKVSKAKN